MLPDGLRLPRIVRRSSGEALLPTSAELPASSAHNKSWFWRTDDDDEDEDMTDTGMRPPLEELSPNVTPKSLSPPPRARPAATIVPLHKPRGTSLGLRFFSDEGDGGAEIQKVDPHSIAWRHGLAWGDTIERVRIMSAFRPGEVRIPRCPQ